MSEADPGGDTYIKRTRAARKGAGIKVVAIAAVLGISPEQYRHYERDEVLPINHMAAFCAMTRCSPFYLLTGNKLATTTSQYVAEVRGVMIPQNRCGAPCVMGRNHWCDLSCRAAE